MGKKESEIKSRKLSNDTLEVTISIKKIIIISPWNILRMQLEQYSVVLLYLQCVYLHIGAWDCLQTLNRVSLVRPTVCFVFIPSVNCWPCVILL